MHLIISDVYASAVNNTNLIQQMPMFAHFPWPAFCEASVSNSRAFTQQQLKVQVV